MPALRCNKADRLLEPVRRRIEQQVLGLSGVGLGTVDFTQPANDRASGGYTATLP